MAITASCYFAMMLWIGLFGSNASVFVAALVGSPLLFLTSQRRCRDANKPQWHGLLSQVPWWLVAIMVSFSVPATWWLAFALIGLIGSMLLAISPSRSLGRFENGYQGPALTSVTKKANATRVEPSLSGEVDHSAAEDTSTVSSSRTSISSQLQEVIEEAPLSQKQWILAGAGVLTLAAMVLFISNLFSNNELDKTEMASEQVEPQVESTPKETVSLRDGFKLSLQNNKLYMIWLGDEGVSEVLWQLTDAKGDRSCRVLKFNNGTTYRPIKVERLPDSSTQADFTPLDTQAIVKDIARRGKISLCGYNFSLKGSQSDLSKNRAFRAIIE